MKESSIERRVVRTVKFALGVEGIKCAPPGSTGWPDRMFLVPGGSPLFIEFKRPGEELTRKQLHIHKLLRSWGYEVQTHDNSSEAFEAVKQFSLKSSRWRRSSYGGTWLAAIAAVGGGRAVAPAQVPEARRQVPARARVRGAAAGPRAR